MLKNLFKKKADEKVPSHAKAVEDFWSDYFHLISEKNWSDTVHGVTLCGKQQWLRSASSDEVALADVVFGSEQTHEGRDYCPGCLEVAQNSVNDQE